MKVFLSYASEERSTAERVQLALRARGYDVFFDRSDLAPGTEYDQAIAGAIASSDLLVFLITPAAVARGRYTLTELRVAEDKWPHPSGRVLPVMLSATDIASIPAYLGAVNILEPRGDVAAETAYEAHRLLQPRSVAGRAWSRIRSPVGIAVMVGVAAIATAALWIARPWDRAAADRKEGYTPLPDDVRHRARAVAAMADGGFVVAAASPSQLLRFSPNGGRVGEAITLGGEPVTLTRTASQIVIATRAPDRVEVVSASDLHVIDTVAYSPARFDRPTGTRPVSGDIQSIAVADGVLWAVTGERDGEASVVRFRQPERQWTIATWPAQPRGFGMDARGLMLRTVGGELWAVTAETTPSTLYRIVGATRVDEFDGHDLRMVSCANDIAESAAANLLFLSCDNELQEVHVDGNRLVPVKVRPTLPSESARGNWTSQIIKRDGNVVFVALSTEITDPVHRPAHARIVRVDDAGVVATLLDLRDAIVTSMAVTPANVVAVLKRADGTADAVVVPRAR